MKRDACTPGVLLTMKKSYKPSNMWEIGNWSAPIPTSPIDKGEIMLGLGPEKGSSYYVSVITRDGRIVSILKENLEVL